MDRANLGRDCRLGLASLRVWANEGFGLLDGETLPTFNSTSGPICQISSMETRMVTLSITIILSLDGGDVRHHLCELCLHDFLNPVARVARHHPDMVTLCGAGTPKSNCPFAKKGRCIKVSSRNPQ